MNVIKSLHASLMQRQFQYNHKHFACSSVYWGFRLSTGEAIAEQEYWTIISKYIDNTGPIDEGMLKEVPEFAVYGNAIAPNKQAVTGLLVEASFAGKRKVLQVSGNRSWQQSGLGKVASQAERFVEMPLNYQHAFGGEEFLQNPIGKGFNTEHLPNVEYPNQLVASSKAQPNPASFGHLSNDWPQRKQYIGTYDQNYIDNHMPGLAPDIDWRYFNAAPQDQWLDTGLCGQEVYEFINLNAEQPKLTGTLPAISARFFVEQLVDMEQSEQTEFKEIPLTLDTVYFFPNDDLGILVHRGSYEIAHPFGKDVQKVILGHEHSHEVARTEQHYQQELEQRSDLEHGWKYLLNTSALLPTGVICGLKAIIGDDVSETGSAQADNLQTFAEQNSQGMDEKLEQQLDKAYQELEKQGCTEEIEQLKQAANKKPSTELDELEDEDLKKMLAIQNKIVAEPEKLRQELDLTKLDLSALEELAEHSKAMAERQKQENIKELRQQIAELRTNPDMTESEEVVLELENILAQLTQLPMLPRTDPNELTESMAFQTESLNKQVDVLDDPEVLKHLSEEQKQKLMLGRDDLTSFDPEKVQQDALEFSADAYLQSAHFMAEARSPHEGEEQHRVDKLLFEHKTGAVGPFVDIAFGEMSHESLLKANLFRGLLEYTILTGCNFTEANLEKANFAKARVTDCNFTAANMKDVNLGAAQFSKCHFAQQNFNEATFGKSTFEYCRFEHCDFGERLDAWLETKLVNCHFVGCDFSGFNFVEIDILSCTFENCQFDATNFIKGQQTGCQFIRCTMNSTSFVTPDLTGAKFNHSLLHNVRFVGGANLAQSDFSDSVVTESNFREAQLSNANFTRAELNKSDFGGANLIDANFDKATAIQSQFIESKLTGSSLVSANMMEANLMQADIRSCNFAQANLYSVSFINAILGETRFFGAYLENTILRDWRP